MLATISCLVRFVFGVIVTFCNVHFQVSVESLYTKIVTSIDSWYLPYCTNWVLASISGTPIIVFEKSTHFEKIFYDTFRLCINALKMQTVDKHIRNK